jgi:hypothetical protein
MYLTQTQEVYMHISEERARQLEQNIRDRAKEKKISHFDAVNELLPQTFDNDEEELLQIWRFQLHPRKQPRNPVERMSQYFANDRPTLGLVVLVLLALYPSGVIYLSTHGHWLVGACLAVPLVLWYAGSYKAGIAMYRSFLPFKENLKRNIDDMRPRFVENNQILGNDAIDAELNASEQLEQLRSFMLAGADTIEPRGSRALLFIAFGFVVLIGGYLVVASLLG